MQETWVGSLGWEGNGNPLQYSCLGNAHGQRSLVGCSPWDRKESDRTEHEWECKEVGENDLFFNLILSCSICSVRAPCDAHSSCSQDRGSRSTCGLHSWSTGSEVRKAWTRMLIAGMTLEKLPSSFEVPEKWGKLQAPFRAAVRMEESIYRLLLT